MLKVSKGSKEITHCSLLSPPPRQQIKVLQTLKMYIHQQRNEKKKKAVYFEEAIGSNQFDLLQLKFSGL